MLPVRWTSNAFLLGHDRYQVEVIGPEGMFTASNGMRMAAHRTTTMPSTAMI